jgi:hypothetical protein
VHPTELYVQFQDNDSSRTFINTVKCRLASHVLVEVAHNQLLNVPPGPLYLYEADGKSFISPDTFVGEIPLRFDERGRQLPLIIISASGNARGWSVRSQKKAYVLKQIQMRIGCFIQNPIVTRHPLFAKIPIFNKEPNLLFNNLGSLNTAQLEACFTPLTSLLAFIGTSGCGKTRMIFELMCNVYGIYISLDNPACKLPGSKDFNYLFERMNVHMRQNHPDLNYEYISHFMMCIFVSRLYLFKHLHQTVKRLTPKKWLLTQLSYDFTELVEDIRKFSFTDLNDEMERLKAYMYEQICKIQMNNNPLRIFMDEMQCSVDKFKGFFNIDNQPYSLYYALVKVTSFTGCCVITSGTGLKLQEANLLSARDIKVVISESFSTIEEVNKAIYEVFKCELKKESAAWLLGRKKFVTSFIEFVIRDASLTTITGDILEEKLGQFLIISTEIKADSVVGSIFLEERLKAPRVRKLSAMMENLRRIVIQGILMGTGIYTTDAQAELFERAFGRLVKSRSGTGLQINIDEPLVFMAALNFFEAESTLGGVDFLREALLSRMSRTTQRSAQGFIWEYFLAVSILGVCLDDWRKLLCKSKILRNVRMSDGRLVQPESQKLLTTSDDCSLLDFLRTRPSIFYQPDTSAGPDLVFFLEVKAELVPVFLQAKFSKNESYTDSMRTVDPDLFYHENRGNKKRKNQRLKVVFETDFRAIQNLLKNSTFVSMLVIYPKQFTKIPALIQTNPKHLKVLFDARNIATLIPAEYLKLLQAITNDRK